MNEVIEYDPLVSFLKQASAFEVYRMMVALQNELDNPIRLAQINAQIKIGNAVEWYDSTKNKFIKALVKKKGTKKITVENIDDGKQCHIPLYWLKLDSRKFVFEEKEKGLNKHNVKVGDYVGFHHSKIEKDIIGQVERINPKSVTILTANQQRWRVTYKLLYSVLEGQQGQSCGVIEHFLK